MTDASKIHLAIIPDGNRRWARMQGLLATKGHESAVENFRTITDWCREHPHIAALTVWCFSTENWKRDPKEVAHLMELLERYLQNERQEFIAKNTRFMHSGRRDRIPVSLASLMKDMMEETKDNRSFTVHLAVDYGGKDEMLRAMQKIEDPSLLTETSFRPLLDQPDLPDIDLIVRTSGEMRTSNFFLWQSTYAEWIFLDKFFPAVSTKDLEKAMNEFDRRTRRFGS